MFQILSQLKKGIILIFGMGLLGVLIIQTERKYHTNPCKQVQIKVIPVASQNFIDEQTITAYLDACGYAIGNLDSLHNISTKALENTIKSHNFVLDCSAHKCWQGDLKIKIVPRKILARIIHRHGPDCYIDNEGMILPLSKTYTSRVVLIESEKKYLTSTSLSTYPEGKELLKMLQIIVADTFWSTELTHIYINLQQEVILSTKFGKHQVHLGGFQKVEDKFQRLKLFYEVILPAKGWDAYKVINLKFDRQIVCEYA